ncbi:MAG: winged helix-turn-helix transcriptional regulator [Candidatus Aenigmarchaeota archaeon]|nr:winged helix-turn-helix transcriptional regulator [Candidatus Aenigmarchaeota archaeon]
MIKTPYKLFFGTLSNEIRLKILHALAEKPKNVTQLTNELGFDQTTVSKNLKRLATCQFITNKKIGKHSIYSLNKKTILPLLKLIDRHVDKYCKNCELLLNERI